MARWDLEATRREIARVHGRRQLELAKPCLRSLADRQFYARFHYQRVRSTLSRYVKQHLDSDDPMPTIFADDQAGWDRFNVVIRKLGADVTACIQSVHAIPDILASAVYFALALDRSSKPQPGRFVNHSFVVDATAGVPTLKDVRSGLRATTAGKSWKHLSALANQSKHYSIVFPALNTDLTGERPERHMVALPAFSARSTQYPQVLVSEFLPPIYDQVTQGVLETGNALHAYLRSAA